MHGLIHDEALRWSSSAIVRRSSRQGRHHVNDALGECCCSKAGVRLPTASLATVHVVANTEDYEVTGQTG